MKNKKIAALLSIALLISLTGCGGNSGGNDVPPSESIEATETPSETPETAPEATESEEATYTPAESETPTEAIAEPIEETSESTEPPAAEQPKETPAPQTPAPTTAPTQTPTPAPTHTHNYVVTQAATCTSNGVKTCSCGDTQVIPATGHKYTTYTVPGTGHYEQVQVGTKSVNQTAEVKEYECRNCGAKFNTYDEFLAHKGDDYVNQTFDSTNPCCGSGYIGRTTTVVVGVTTEPIYETQWVVDTPDTTVHVCEVCGQEE